MAAPSRVAARHASATIYLQRKVHVSSLIDPHLVKRCLTAFISFAIAVDTRGLAPMHGDSAVCRPRCDRHPIVGSLITSAAQPPMTDFAAVVRFAVLVPLCRRDRKTV